MTTHASPITGALRHDVAVATDQGLRVLGEPRGGPSVPMRGRITAVHANGDDLWILEDHRHLHRLAAGGAIHVASLDRGRATCIVVHDGAVWVGGDDAALWRLEGTELEAVGSFDHAPSRDEWHTPWGGPPAVFSMASRGDDLFVGVHVGGIIRTSDHGRSWAPTIDLHVDVHQVAVDGDGTLWAATGARGLARSVDRGDTWQYLTDGLHATYLLAVAPAAGGVLVGASSGHAGRDGAIYRLAGDRFERCVDGLPDDLGGALGPGQLGAAGVDVAAATPAGDVYASGDGGRRWTLLAEDLPPVAAVALR